MKPKRASSIFRNIYEQPYHEANRIKLYNSAKGSLDLVQRLGLLRKLPIHNGCVNCICWSDNGDLLLSGSDDQHLVVSHAYTCKMLTDYKTSHRANIFSAKFLPCSGDKNIISCSGDGIILFTDLVRPSDTHNCQFNCHVGTTYEVATIPGDPHTFLSCGEDYSVRCFDLRIKESCNKPDCQEDVLICCQRAVTALTINTMAPHLLAVGCSDSTVRLFDRRMLGTISSGFSCRSGIRPVLAVTAPGLEGKSYRITSLAFSPEGEDILVSYSSEHLYLFSTLNQSHSQLFKQDNCSGDDESGDNCVDMDGVKPVVGLPPIRRLRLRGDWSDTGPDARPEREPGRSGDVAQARPTLHATLMQRMTDVLSRMLNDPATRAALSHGGEDEPEPFNENDNEHDNSNSASARPDLENADNENDSENVEEQENLQEPEFVDLGRVLIDNNQPDQFLQVSDGPPVDPIWSPETETQASSPTTTQNETVSLPSFESTYSSYSLVKSPTVPQPQSSCSDHPSSPAVPSSLEVSDSTSQVQTTLSSSSPSSSSTSSSSSSSRSLSSPHISGSSSNASDRSLRSLTNQLSYMRHGFIEKHGTEPMVNLHYSDKGSTASRITMSVADEVNREQVDNHRIDPSITSSINSVNETEGSDRNVSETAENANDVNNPGSSTNNDLCSNRLTPPQKFITEPQCTSVPSTMIEPVCEEDNNSIFNSDDESDSSTTPVPAATTQETPLHQDPLLARSADNYLQRDLERDTGLSSCSSSSQFEHGVNDKVKLKQVPIKQKYTGHRNARTMIKEATFWGTDYVLSGSDCGHVFVWNRKSARLVMLLEADHHVVNCIQPHPQLPLLATSGIDYDVKLWAPIHEEPVFDPEMAEELMKRNEVMLEETKDTITVPASFMIRMLACLNQIRRRRSRTRPGSRVGPGGEGPSNSSE